MRTVSDVSAAAARAIEVVQWRAGTRTSARDRVAVEAPLTITVTRPGEADLPLALTMRTPGSTSTGGADEADPDLELAVGFLFGEGLVTARGDVARVARVGADEVRVELAASAPPLPATATRRFAVTSACGICGRGPMDRPTRTNDPAVDAWPVLAPATLQALPARLAAAQPAFGATGGLHAAALFTASGELLLLREDVGRHNAVDKLVGRLWLDGGLPAADALLLLSGRASFELLDKAARAGIRIVASVGAPSSLAVDTARSAGITLVGFLRDDRCNVYTHAARVRAPGDPPTTRAAAPAGRR
jgi:FdhD protein